MLAIWNEEPVFCVTLDVDWASEDVLRDAQRLVEAYDITPTYFLTHPSDFLDGLLERGEIEAGLHPNFLPHSSHGEGFDQVLAYCLRLMEHPRCFRSHRYFDVTDITHALAEAGLEYEGNVCTLLQQGIAPFRHESGLVRFPTFFEDGTYLATGRELAFGPVSRSMFEQPGLKIIALHPLDMALNTPELGYARAVKDRLSREAMTNMSAADLAEIKNPRRGVRDYVSDLLEWVRGRELPLYSFDELYHLHQEYEYGGGTMLA